MYEYVYLEFYVEMFSVFLFLIKCTLFVHRQFTAVCVRHVWHHSLFSFGMQQLQLSNE